jgi:hypothetical protein
MQCSIDYVGFLENAKAKGFNFEVLAKPVSVTGLLQRVSRMLSPPRKRSQSTQSELLPPDKDQASA